MPKKRFLTIDDLVKFCKKEGMTNFNAKGASQKIIVQVPASFSKIESDEFTLYCYAKLMHTGRNKNGSNLTDKAARHCMSSLAYKPLLANFTDVNGEWDFTSHDFTVTEDENGNEIYDYQEKQVGCFTSDKPYMEYDEVNQHDYIYARVAIPRQYTKTAEIIERKDGTKISVELEILEMSYDAKEKLLCFDDAVCLGATCLGVSPETGEEIGEGMADAHLSLQSFSAENNSMINAELLEQLRLFNKNFETMNTDILEEGGKDVDKFEELLKQYNIAAEDVDFEYENLSEDELVAKFAEVFGDDGDNPEPENDADSEDNPDDAPEPRNDDEPENADSNDNDNDVTETFSVTMPNGVKKDFWLITFLVRVFFYHISHIVKFRHGKFIAFNRLETDVSNSVICQAAACCPAVEGHYDRESRVFGCACKLLAGKDDMFYHFVVLEKALCGIEVGLFD